MEPGGDSQDARNGRRGIVRWILASALLLPDAKAAAQRLLASPAGTGAPRIARAATLPPVTDLAADARASARERKPILLFFDREECPYCERALREYLVPMASESGARAIFRQVEIDLPRPAKSFDGTATTHRELAQRYRITLSPTVLVVGPRGEPLAGPLVGLSSVDFYGAYLENAIDEAIRKMG